MVYATFQDGRSNFDLEDVDGRILATVEIEARYVPVPVKLEPRESINSECFRYSAWFSVILYPCRPRHSSRGLAGRERYPRSRQRRFVPRIFGNSLSDIIVTGKSDPFAVFSLNSQKVFKSQTKKKTLNPDWNENFVASIVSR